MHSVLTLKPVEPPVPLLGRIRHPSRCRRAIIPLDSPGPRYLQEYRARNHDKIASFLLDRFGNLTQVWVGQGLRTSKPLK